jgi:hypothetical protein
MPALSLDRFHIAVQFIAEQALLKFKLGHPSLDLIERDP